MISLSVYGNQESEEIHLLEADGSLPNYQLHNSEELSPPSFVYLATITEPRRIFADGFVRSGESESELWGRPRSTDLSEHLYQEIMNQYDICTALECDMGQADNPSAFITTSIDAGYLFRRLIRFLWDHRFRSQINRTIYIYQIVPQSNFISVVDTYERALRNELNPVRYQNLARLDEFYTRGNEYAALNFIPSSAILGAWSYTYDPSQNNYVSNGFINNLHFQQSPPP